MTTDDQSGFVVLDPIVINGETSKKSTSTENSNSFPNKPESQSSDELSMIKSAIEILKPLIDRPLSVSDVASLHNLLNPEKKREGDENKEVSTASLPAFPEQANAGLSAEPNIIASLPPIGAPVSDLQPISSEQQLNLKKEVIESWNKFVARQTLSETENTHLAEFRKALDSIEEKYIVQVVAAMSAVFPLQKAIRHGTPEEKRFATIVAGDRFLSCISGVSPEIRKILVKKVARYLTDISDQYGFLSNEGGSFDNEMYERAEGSSSSGKTIREVQGFVVITKPANKVFRLGRALV